jgi:membrane protein YqaA with SNARE-associated domain
MSFQAVLFAGQIKKIGDLLADIGSWLLGFGALGLFGIALLDSALVPLPSGPDVIMIALSAARPALMPVYALAATVGSTMGCTILYLAARKAGAVALRRVSEGRRRQIEGLLGRYDMLAVMVPAILPPPFPFKAFVLSAGVFKLKLVRFVIAIAIGRAGRFFVEGWLAIWFGDDAVRLLKQHGLAVIVAVAVVALAVMVLMRLRSRPPKSSLSPVDKAAPSQSSAKLPD